MQADRPLSLLPPWAASVLTPSNPWGYRPPTSIARRVRGITFDGSLGPGKGRLAACSVPAQAAYPQAACGSEGAPDLSGCLGPGPAAGWGRGARGR